MITKLALYLPENIFCSCDEFSVGEFSVSFPHCIFDQLFSTSFPRFINECTIKMLSFHFSCTRFFCFQQIRDFSSHCNWLGTTNILCLYVDGESNQRPLTKGLKFEDWIGLEFSRHLELPIGKFPLG